MLLNKMLSSLDLVLPTDLISGIKTQTHLKNASGLKILKRYPRILEPQTTARYDTGEQVNSESWVKKIG